MIQMRSSNQKRNQRNFGIKIITYAICSRRIFRLTKEDTVLKSKNLVGTRFKLKNSYGPNLTSWTTVKP